MSITRKPFGTLKNGQAVTEYTLSNQSGASVGILDLGGIITHIRVPDRLGQLTDVALGFDDASAYIAAPGYLGALIGRVGNRIGNASFTLNGEEYVLEKNDGENNLHGGLEGFNLRMWQASPIEMDSADALLLSLTSPDGDQGFPGSLDVEVTYTFNDANALGIHYYATTDKPTLCNLTNHAYFNLDGHDGSIEDLELQIFADVITEVDDKLIPTGRLLASHNLPYSFAQPTRLGDVLALTHSNPTLKSAGGVDINYCMGRDRETKICAELYSPKTGRVMTVETDQPGVQVYTGQGLNIRGKQGAFYGPFGGICLETQHYPDAIHYPQFHSVVLRPQDIYDTVTVYHFGAR